MLYVHKVFLETCTVCSIVEYWDIAGMPSAPNPLLSALEGSAMVYRTGEGVCLHGFL